MRQQALILSLALLLISYSNVSNTESVTKTPIVKQYHDVIQLTCTVDTLTTTKYFAAPFILGMGVYECMIYISQLRKN